jgi:polysaccharide biosynthesis protein PslG
VGVQYRGMWGDQTDRQRRELLDRMQAAGVEWLRVGVPWVMMQPRPPTAGDPGWAAFAFDRLSDIVRWAKRRDMVVSGTFGRTPDWANGGLGDTHLATDPDQFARSLQHIARVFRGRINSWEIWNEPNHENYLQGATMADYKQALCAAHAAVKQANPGAKVVAGGTAGNDWEWYRALYRAGAKPCFDVVATHPYNSDKSPYYTPPSDIRGWFQNITLVRRVMNRFDDGHTPVWFTEVGWSTHPDPTDGSPPGVTMQEQARYLRQLFRITHRRYPYVRRVSWYCDMDMTISTVHKNHFGLMRLDRTPKPAYFALKDYTAHLNR